MLVLLSTLFISAAIMLTIGAVVVTLSDYGAEIGRAWRMERLAPRGDGFYVRQQRQPLVSPTGRLAPDRRAIRRVAAA